MTSPTDEPPSPSEPISTAAQDPITYPDAESQEELEEDRKRKKILRRKTIQFIVVFMVSVLVLLTGYESVKTTPQNDRYLFNVAQSTAFLLKWVGYSVSVGNPRQYAGKEAEVRAKIAAWEQGQDAPAEAPPGISTAPLTAWESYNYESLQWHRAIHDAEAEVERLKKDADPKDPALAQQIQAAQMKVADMKGRDRGPYVGFVYKAGLTRQLTDQRAKLEAIKADTNLPDADRTAKTAQVQAQIDQLEKQVQDAKAAGPPAGKPGDKATGDRFFNFIVIPDCGAVQSMAIFFAAVIAFPGVRWWRRVLGIIIGVTLLYWVNAFRLAFLAVVGALDNGGAIFKFAHEYVWQGIYIVFVVAIWMAWVELLVRRRD